ncbi:TPA: RNA methyltransferase [Aeromonas hydrophila]|nr:RNA methyltransferase [Aeromonas hydrophila]
MTGWPSGCEPSKQEMIYVAIPHGCINLAASINVILYDRLAKQLRSNSAS